VAGNEGLVTWDSRVWQILNPFGPYVLSPRWRATYWTMLVLGTGLLIGSLLIGTESGLLPMSCIAVAATLLTLAKGLAVRRRLTAMRHDWCFGKLPLSIHGPGYKPRNRYTLHG
jgi:hypothetical protein